MDSRIGDYYLDINAINISIKSIGERQKIHEYYRDMLNAYEDKRVLYADSLFLTLKKSGYLVDNRVDKIRIINESNNN